MPHSLVTQLRFTRSEFVRCLEGVSPEDALRRLEPMNCLSWIVGHLASQEHHLWVEMAQGRDVASFVYTLTGYDCGPTTPDWDEMWEAWRTTTQAADDYLESVTAETLDAHLQRGDQRSREPVGILLLRNIYHYWFHLGEGHALRQQLGHEHLPQFVGNMAGVSYR